MRVAIVFLVACFIALKTLVGTEEHDVESKSVEEEERESELDKEELEKEKDTNKENTEEDGESDEEVEKENTNGVREITEDGFSFHKFSRPINEEVKKVVVPNSNPQQPGLTSIDYRGKPDYSFGYGVHDDFSKNSHLRVESRNGNAVQGEYRVLQPDGLVRIVKYLAHPTTGFQAHISYGKY